MAVTIEEALALIYSHVTPKHTELIPIEDAINRVIAQDITANHNLPPYDNSAMDGYAVKVSDGGQCVQVMTTIFAGDNDTSTLSPGFCCKIMTGAKIPEGTECIVPIEDVISNDKGITLPNLLTSGRHIRLCGEDIEKGTLLLTAGQRLGAHHITLLVSQGISHIQVYGRIRIAVFASGSELKMHYETVTSYQLYNTNTPTFMARSKELGCEVRFIGTAKDSLTTIQEHIRSALDSDLIITSGGVSVGDADYTKEAFAHFGFTPLFDKVNIKPGKPTTFGYIEKTLVLNLPGNPLAAALNFELFAQSIILALSGATEKYLGTIQCTLKQALSLKPGRRTLIPGWYDGVSFEPCQHVAPGMISPLAHSNAYIMIDEKTATLSEGCPVAIIPTRFGMYQKTTKSLVTS